MQHWRTDRAAAEAASTALDAGNRGIARLQPAQQQPPAAPQDALQQQLQEAARFWGAKDSVQDLLGLQRSQKPKAAAPAAGSKRQHSSAHSAARGPRPDRQVTKRAKHAPGELSPSAQLMAAQLLELVAARHKGSTAAVGFISKEVLQHGSWCMDCGPDDSWRVVQAPSADKQGKPPKVSLRLLQCMLYALYCAPGAAQMPFV